MSWNAHLVDDRGHTEGDWNYTHNCNGMANIAAEEAGVDIPIDTTECWALPAKPGGAFGLTHYPTGTGDRLSWWRHLDGMSGPEGASFLDKIIRGLEADPDRFRAKNPENGWGDFDSFLKTLTEMRNAVPEWPTKWSVNG